MTLKELIEELQRLPDDEKDMEVASITYNDFCSSGYNEFETKIIGDWKGTLFLKDKA